MEEHVLKYHRMTAHGCAACPLRAFECRLRICAGCGVERYCSPRCQKAHWPAHRGPCRALAAERDAALAALEAPPEDNFVLFWSRAPLFDPTILILPVLCPDHTVHTLRVGHTTFVICFAIVPRSALDALEGQLRSLLALGVSRTKSAFSGPLLLTAHRKPAEARAGPAQVFARFGNSVGLIYPLERPDDVEFEYVAQS